MISNMLCTAVLIGGLAAVPVAAGMAPARAQAAGPAVTATHRAVHGDIDGDRRSDLVVADVGRVYVYYTSARPGGSRMQTLTGFRHPADLAVADVNDDGYGDLIVGDDERSGNRGAIVVYYGSSTGVRAGNPTVLRDADGTGLGSSIMVVDFNRDGYPDIAGESYQSSRVRIFLGGPHGVSGKHHSTLRLSDVSAMAVGDVNGDGRPDLVVGRPAAGKRHSGHVSGIVDVLYGRRHGYRHIPQRISGRQAGAGYGFFGNTVAVARLDGDRFADVVVGAPDTRPHENGALVVLYGGRHGPSTRRSTVITPADMGWRHRSLFGAQCGEASVVADFDGDGRPDVAVGANGSGLGRGAVFVLYGNRQGLDPTRAQILRQDDVAAAGKGATDFGEDLGVLRSRHGRYASLVVSASSADGPGGRASTGFVDVFGGSAKGLQPVRRIAAPRPERMFGTAIAG